MKLGIRKRLILLFLYAAAIECALMLVISGAMWITTNFISSSYNSNLKIQEYQTAAQNVLEKLESYMNLKSYENINGYLHYKAELEKLSLDFEKKPCHQKTRLCEYTTYKFSESFLNYSENAVFLRRQGNFSGAMENFNKAKNAYMFFSQSIEKLNQLYFTDNMNRYSSVRISVRRLVFSSVVITASVSIVVSFLLLMFVSSIIQPLTEISESANQLAERNFDIPLFEYNKSDEIGNICRAFNRMILSIREYIDTIWEKAIRENELKEKEMKMTELYQSAKLTALQAQINPHFLFNTLNTGAQLAMMEGSDRTCDFLEKVADFYRYNLQFSCKESVLEDEVHLIESYVYIMKVRFGDHFDFYKEITSERLNIPFPGMVLQPLVENCIKHGIGHISKGGKIMFRIYDQEEYVVISISDNGAGFPAEKRKQILAGISEKMPETVIQSSDDSGTGVGLTNVISRLKLFSKNESVFDIKESDEGGTEFVIRIKNV